MAVKELFAQLHEVAAAPKKQLEKYLAEGKKVVAVAPVYTPQEIIHSMGMVPMGVWGADMELNESKKYYPAFICSIMQSILELGLKGEYDGVSAHHHSFSVRFLKDPGTELEICSKGYSVYSHDLSAEPETGLRRKVYKRRLYKSYP